MYTEKLTEINKTELWSGNDYKYVITAYEDVTKVDYYEPDESKVMKLRSSFDLACIHDIQICETIIRLRKEFKD